MFTADEEVLGVKSRSPKERSHAYLTGNFEPVRQVHPLTPCAWTGKIPSALLGGQYVRNGANAHQNGDQRRDAHWFDGDGMLTGVAFQRAPGNTDAVQPEFVNQYVLTDVFISSATSRHLKKPIVPSLTTLVNPLASLIQIVSAILRTIFLVILSRLPGSKQVIKKISVANTGIIYHDGRVLATCESGPPMRISLPSLETVGWLGGTKVEGETDLEGGTDSFGKNHVLSFIKEFTTAHPRVDPANKDLVLFHSCPLPPYVNYSVIPDTLAHSMAPRRMTAAPVPGIASPKLMHDFGVSSNHTVIMDLPLSLDPLNLAKNKAVVGYDSSCPARFGVFPRWSPARVRWFETVACCIFHTVNTWDDLAPTRKGDPGSIAGVHMLACRLTSASLVFSAGNIEQPAAVVEPLEEDQCRLYYYHFDLLSPTNYISQQWALSIIPFEFPSIRDDMSMANAKYVYGCSVSDTSFGAALGGAAKINALVKVDAETLIARGRATPPISITGSVDNRSTHEILTSGDPNDPIKIFKLPAGWYAQEPRFVGREKGTSEDDGWILSYVFDESQLDATGRARSSATSELWIIDAKNMTEIVARIHLPQRVPYGLHGNWFTEKQIQSQRPISQLRRMPTTTYGAIDMASNGERGTWATVRDRIERVLG